MFKPSRAPPTPSSPARTPLLDTYMLYTMCVTYMYIYIYIYTYIYIYIMCILSLSLYTYMYIYIYMHGPLLRKVILISVRWLSGSQGSVSSALRHNKKAGCRNKLTIRKNNNLQQKQIRNILDVQQFATKTLQYGTTKARRRRLGNFHYSEKGWLLMKVRELPWRDLPWDWRERLLYYMFSIMHGNLPPLIRNPP